MAETVEHNQEKGARRALTPEELKKRKQRNLAIGFGLVVFIVLVFLTTVFRLSASVAEKSF